ncbi:hypothetical protein NY78_3280 [Desulfovibrio sp. TomC]|nr:hypothetical protein NY78_3280 [Desulfovibrio sp. TomC]
MATRAEKAQGGAEHEAVSLAWMRSVLQPRPRDAAKGAGLSTGDRGPGRLQGVFPPGPWSSGLPRRVCGTQRAGLLHTTGRGLIVISFFGKKRSGRPGQATAGRLACRHLCQRTGNAGARRLAGEQNALDVSLYWRDRWRRGAVEGAIHLKDGLNLIWLRYLPVCDNCGCRQGK